MMASQPEPRLTTPTQRDIDWLLAQGIDIMTMVRPSPVMIATGFIAEDGLFEHAENSERWLALEEAEDIVFWQPRRCTTSTWCRRTFALGESIMDDASTYAFDCALNIFSSPLDWLRAERDGIVVIDWSRAFDRLRDAPRITIAEELLPLYRRQMKPRSMPELFVIQAERRAA